MHSMWVRQPVGPNKNYWFYPGVEVSVIIALLSVGAGSILRGLAVILHLKYNEKV